MWPVIWLCAFDEDGHSLLTITRSLEVGSCVWVNCKEWKIIERGGQSKSRIAALFVYPLAPLPPARILAGGESTLRA